MGERSREGGKKKCLTVQQIWFDFAFAAVVYFWVKQKAKKKGDRSIVQLLGSAEKSIHVEIIIIVY